MASPYRIREGLDNTKYPDHISDGEIYTRYSYLMKDIDRVCVWLIWLSSCKWDKSAKTLFLDKKDQSKVYIGPLHNEILERGPSRKIVIIQSDVTGVWYPFRYENGPETITAKFRCLDDKCPIDYLILER
jgi:hypothetical protein